MAGKVLQLEDVIASDDLAKAISDQWRVWNMLRQEKIEDWEEIRAYRYATDTTQTSNNDLPWKNKTTLPKLTQISDNLHANYMKSLFPKRKWLIWEGYDEKSEQIEKKTAIESYMATAIERSKYETTMGQLVDDWIMYGNCFSTIDWADDRVEQVDKTQLGYVGPRVRRISPLDIVFNPIAPSFESTPKIVRKWVLLGDLKAELESLSAPETETQELYEYLLGVRTNITAFAGEISSEDEYLKVDGFTDFRSYLGSDYVEILTFYGDLYDRTNDTLYNNHVITVVDRHKLIEKKPNPSFFGHAPIFHSGWRTRSDNLWAMGPLDNLIGMQYRIDHLENLKADVFDLNAFPPLKIKGYIDDFEWGPMERIYVGDEGDVEMIAPDFQILNTNLEIDNLERKMEEMAGAPKEAMGFRTPGEKTKYEVQRLENASGRIFQTKIERFETEQVETTTSAMLEISRRRMSDAVIRTFDDELKVATFTELTAQDITGNGRLRPVGAKHFAEQAERVQNWTAFVNSGIGQDPSVNVHFSGLAMAKMFEEILEGKPYQLVTPFVRISEQTEAQKLMNVGQEDVLTEAGTPTGLTPDDVSDTEIPSDLGSEFT